MHYIHEIIEVEKIADKQILVTTADVKAAILRYRMQANIIDNLKIMTEREFITAFVYVSNPELLQYLIDNNPWAENKLQPKLAMQLEQALYLIKNADISNHPLYSYMQQVSAIGLLPSPQYPQDYNIIFYLPIIDDLITVDFEVSSSNLSLKSQKINKYGHYLDEIETCLEEIAHLLSRGVEFANIHVLMASDYKPLFTQMANVYNIPLKRESKLPLLAHKDGVYCLEQIKKNQPIDFEQIDQVIVEPVVSILNRYAQYGELSKYIDLVITDFELEQITVASSQGIELKTKIDSLYTKQDFQDGHFFLLGNYQDGLVNYVKDINIVGDEYRQNLVSTADKNKRLDYLLCNIINKAQNLTLSYSTKLLATEVKVANQLKDFTICKRTTHSHSEFSKAGDLLKFGRANYIYQTFKTSSLPYQTLAKYYQIEYKDNKYQPIAHEHQSLKLSYTSINDFYKCSYRYYLSHILRIKNGQFDSRKIIVGNIVHYVLENIDSSVVQTKEAIRTIIDRYVADNKIEVTAIDDIYFNKFSIFLEMVCTYMIQEEASSGYSQIVREAEFEMPIIDNVTLVGKIDKILSNIEGDDLFVEIYDYKTGSLTIDMSKIEYGLDMQNLIYFLLIKDYYKHEQGSEVLVGTYQHQIKQKLLFDDQEVFEMMPIKGYSLKKQENVFIRKEKIIDSKTTDELLQVVSEKITDAATNILANQFEINPKIIDGKNCSCNFCQYMSICNRTNQDLRYIIKEK